MASNNSTGLLLLGGATALFLMNKGKAQDSSSNFSGGSGGGSGLIIVPSGVGASEVTNPNSSSFNPPAINIYESALPEAPTDTPQTKKEASSTSFVQSGIDKIYDPKGAGLAGGYYDNSGKIVGVADPIAQQSRLPTATEKLLNTPSYSSSGSSSTKKASSGTTTGTFQGLPVSIPSSSSTKKESSSSPTPKTSVLSKIGSAIGSVIKRSIFR